MVTRTRESSMLINANWRNFNSNCCSFLLIIFHAREHMRTHKLIPVKLQKLLSARKTLWLLGQPLYHRLWQSSDRQPLSSIQIGRHPFDAAHILCSTLIITSIQSSGCWMWVVADRRRANKTTPTEGKAQNVWRVLLLIFIRPKTVLRCRVVTARNKIECPQIWGDFMVEWGINSHNRSA